MATDQVDEVKQKTDIVSLLGEYIQVKKAGRNYKALCPFHSEKTPSFMISPELQMYKCFGCGESGDVFTFLEKYEGMEFREALKFLADRAGVKLVAFHPGEESEKERLYQINSLAARFYNYILLNHSAGKTALNYLTKERGLQIETIKTFQIGFSPDVPEVLKRFLVDKKKFQLGELERSGLTVNVGDRIIDKFRGRIIFPLFDHRGNIAGFAGRILPGGNDELAKYINSPETPIYHKSRMLFGLNLVKGEIKNKDEAILVEGEMDMIPLWQAGFKNAVAIKGTALTDEQIKLISRFAEKITFSLDADFAGDTAARRGVVLAQREGLEVKVARLEGYKDPGEAVGKDPDYYRKALGQAVGVWDFIIDSIFAKMESQSGEGKAKISREVVPVLNSIPDKIVQAHYIEIVAKRLGVGGEAVSSQVQAALGETSREAQDKKVVEIVREPEKGRRQLLEERLMTLAFQSDPKILLGSKVGRLIQTPLAKRIFEEYKDYSEKHDSFSPSGFAEGLPKELVEGFAELALRDTQDLVESQKDFSREFELVLRELQIEDIQRGLEASGVKIREFEEKGEKDKLIKEQEKFKELSQRLTKLRNREEGVGEGIILQETNI